MSGSASKAPGEARRDRATGIGLVVAVSRQHTAIALGVAALLAGCAGPGYEIAGPALRAPVPGLVVAGAEVAPTRAHPRPEIEVLRVCPGGETLADGPVLTQEVGEDGRRLVTVAAEHGGGTSQVRFAPGSEAFFDVSVGDRLRLRTLPAGGHAVCVGEYLVAEATALESVGDPEPRLQPLAWQEVTWRLAPSQIAESLRVVGNVMANAWDARQRRFRLIIRDSEGVDLEVRYTPVGAQGLSARPGQRVELELRDAEAEAGFRGKSLILRTAQGLLLAALAGGGGLPHQPLPGVEVKPTRRVVYAEARQMPSLCLASVEHLALEIRRGGGRVELPPGTYALVAHDSGDYRVSALDVSRAANGDTCGDETVATLSYAISLITGAPVMEDASTTGASFGGHRKAKD